MRSDLPIISSGSQTPPKGQLPQMFYVKLRRGRTYKYVTETGESDSITDAKDFVTSPAAYAAALTRLREVGVDGAEVESVSR